MSLEGTIAELIIKNRTKYILKAFLPQPER